LIHASFKEELGNGKFDTRFLEIPLYSDEDFKVPKWYFHPKAGYHIDVIAIPLDGLPTTIKTFPINKQKEAPDLQLEVSDDVFVLGFPFGIDGGKLLPIWKRGSVASEPGIDYGGLPCFLVDTASRPGMSGSPVILKRRGKEMIEDNGIPFPYEGTFRNFIGVYSGRIGAEDDPEYHKIQLGVVWKKHVINEILEGCTFGDIAFQNI
jgi:hypothetical protein